MEKSVEAGKCHQSGGKSKDRNFLKRTHTALNNFNFVMPNCYAKPFRIFSKLIISFIINAIIKVVRARGLEPPILTEPDPKSGVSANSTTRATDNPSAFTHSIEQNPDLPVRHWEFLLNPNSLTR